MTNTTPLRSAAAAPVDLWQVHKILRKCQQRLLHHGYRTWTLYNWHTNQSRLSHLIEDRNRKEGQKQLRRIYKRMVHTVVTQAWHHWSVGFVRYETSTCA